MQMNSSNDACNNSIQTAQIPDAFQRLEVAITSLGEALDALWSKIGVACLEKEKPEKVNAPPETAVEVPRCVLAQRVVDCEERVEVLLKSVVRMLDELEL